MKVTEITNINDEGDGYLEIKVDGKTSFLIRSMNECPEDAHFGRDLSECFNIVNLMKKAYEAGKNGEEFTVEYVDESEVN